MIDVHTHILPFIDGGSNSLEKSIEMLKNEYALGVSDVFLTPYYKVGNYEFDKQTILEKYNEFLKNVNFVEDLPKLHLGQENFCDKTIYKREENNEIICLGDSKSVLLEFDYIEKTDICDYVYNFNILGYHPIVSNVERYRYLDYNKILSIKLNGGLIQINAPAIIGYRGKHIQSYVLKLIKHGLVDLVASNVHQDINNFFKDAYVLIKRKFSTKVANDLFINNAKKYILNTN